MSHKRTTVVAGLLTLLVAVAVVVALRSTLYEWWLLRRLESEQPDKTVIKTLGKLGSVRAIPRLLEIAADGEHDFVWSIKGTSRDGASEEDDSDWASYAELAFEALCKVTARSGIRATRPLLGGLECPRPSVRALALWLLGRSGMEPGLFAERAVQALNDNEDQVQGTAEGVVKRLGPAAVPSLRRALEKPGFQLNPEVQSALSSLGQDARLLAPILIGRSEVELNESWDEITALGSVGRGSLAVARWLAQSLANENEVIADRASFALDRRSPLVRLLAYALANEEEAAVDKASRTLQERFPVGRHTVQVLREALTSTTAKARRRAVETLTGFHDEALSPAPDLVRRLRDQDPEVRGAAARALGYAGASGDEVVAALAEALQDPVDAVRSGALLAFLNLSETVSIPVSEVEARLGDESAVVRRMAARLLLEVCGADPLILPACIEKLGSATSSSRQDAVEMITHLGPMARDAASHLADHVHDPETSREVLKALLALGADAVAAAPALLEALDTEDAERFGPASEALVSAAPQSPEFLGILREALRGPEPSIQPLAAAALWRLGKDQVEAMEVLARALRDSDGKIREAAVAGFVSMGSEMVPRLLAETLNPASPSRGATAAALGRLGAAEPAVIAALGLVAQDQGSDAGDSALEALIALGSDPTGPLLQALQSSDRRRRSFAVDRIYARGLGTIELKRPLELILGDKEPEDLATAAMILLRLDPAHESAGRVLARAVAEDEGRFESDPFDWYFRELTALASTSPAAVEALLAFYRRSDGSPLDGRRLEPSGDGQAPFVAPLAAALASEDENTRHLAACLLRDSGPAGAAAVPALVACLEDSSARVRVRAALTLGAIGPAAAPLAAVALTRQLGRRQDLLMRASVLAALGDLGAGARDALPALFAIVSEEAEDVPLRCLALEAAVCIGGEGAIEPGLRVLVDRGPGILRRYGELLRVGVEE